MLRNHLAVVPDEHDVDQINRDLIAEFATYMEVAASTRVKYRAHLEEFRVWLAHQRGGGNGISSPRLLTGVDARDVYGFMAYLRSDERFAATVPGARALSASSRKSVLASLRSFFRYAMSVRLTALDPSVGVRAPRVKIKPGLVLTAQQVHELLNARGSARERIVTFLLVYTGARAGELRDLRWHDVDFVERTITLHGKGKTRILALHPRLVSELRLWLVAQERQAERCPAIRQARANRETDYVLLTRNGLQLGVNAIAKQIKRRAARAGVYSLEGRHGEHRSLVSPHALRRTFATLLLNSGQELDAISDLLGHSYRDTTRRHYAHSNTARLRATIEALPL